MHRSDVYRLIDGEREYQEALPPSRSNHEPVDVGGYLSLIQHYLNEAHKAWAMNPGSTPALDVVRKITALGVHCMEDHGAPPRIISKSKFPIVIALEVDPHRVGTIANTMTIAKPEDLPSAPFRVLQTNARG